MTTPRTFDQSTIVVAGGSGGLGSRIATRLRDQGARVVAVGRDPDRLAALGEGVTTVTADLTEPGSAKAVADAAGEQVHGLVNAAGAVAFGPVAETDDEVAEALVAINLLAPLRLTRMLLPRMVDGGFIANITGVVSVQPMAGLAAYSASKAGFGAATTALRRELRKQQIDVIDVRPPHTETGLATRPLAGTVPKLPTGADPDHVADVIVGAIRDGAREVDADAFG